MINNLVQYFNADGTPTMRGIELGKRLARLEAKVVAIAAVTPPSGGATQDAESRTALNDIITGAGE